MSLSRMFNRISKRNSLIFASALVVCGALIALVVLRHVTAPTSFAYKHIPGERLIYRLDYKSFSVADFKVLFQGKDSLGKQGKVEQTGLSQSFKTTVQGKLVATVVDRKADSIQIAYRLHTPRVTLVANEQEAVTQAEIIGKALSRVIFAEVSAQGRVCSVWFDPAIDNSCQHYARSLLAMTQFVLPGDKSSECSQWEVKEDDPTGHYIARYEARSAFRELVSGVWQTSLKTFRKTKIDYLTQTQPKTNTSKIPTTFEPEGSLEAIFDVSGGHLASLSGSETQIIMMAGKRVAHVENTLHLKFIKKETLRSTELSAMQDDSIARKMVANATPLSARISEEESEAAVQSSELGGATIKSLLDRLANAEAKGERRNTALYLKFKALIYLNPETCSTLGKILMKAKPKSLTMRIISGALGVIGHPQAQSALINAIRARPKDSAALVLLVKDLTSADSPTSLAVNTLRNLMTNSQVNDVVATAQLALGNMAKNLAGRSPIRAGKIVDWLIKEIQSSTTLEQKRQILLALGNTGSLHALPTIIRYLSDPSPDLRSVAAPALRWIDSSKADILLAKVLTSDPNTSVRREAAFALSFRKPLSITYQAQKKAFLYDEAVIVRLKALHNLWQVHKDFPEVRRLVRQAAKNDPSEDVRRATSDILAMYSKEYFDE